MKKVFPALFVLVLVFFIVSFFIPIRTEKKVFIANTFTNIITSLFQPRSWINWDSSVSQAWHRDSSSCHFGNDTVNHIVTIDIPGKKIRITQLSYILYQVEEEQRNHHAVLGLGIIPFVGNGQIRSQHNSYIIYTESTNLFYKIFPFMERSSFVPGMMSALPAYLADTRQFYGYSIEVKEFTDTLFLTKKEDIPVQDLFNKVAVLSKELEQYARENNCRVLGKNISTLTLPHDSVTLMEGINIDKVIPGDYLYNFRQFPSGQMVASAHYEGRFRDRPALYATMTKFLLDHQLVKIGVPFEKYLSPLPTSDSSLIKIELVYPLTY